MGKYTKNEDDTFYLLFPENLDTSFEYIISEKAIEASPK